MALPLPVRKVAVGAISLERLTVSPRSTLSGGEFRTALLRTATTSRERSEMAMQGASTRRALFLIPIDTQLPIMSSVNVPTNPKIKEADINKKLQLYGIYSAFANGKAPSNKQIDIALNSALASKPLKAPSAKLSAEGKHLVADLRDVIEKAKLLLLTKNEGNLLQDFIWQSQHITSGDASKPGLPVDKDTAKQHGNEALDGLRTLGTLLITNVNDAVILLRDIAGDTAAKAAGKLKPDEEALQQIDRPADDNTWHEAPDLSADKLKSQLKETANKVKPGNKADLQNAADKAANGDVDGAATGLQNQASANVDDDTKAQAEKAKEDAKAKAKEAREKTQAFLKEKMPKERREQTIWRLKKMVVEIQGHQDYQRAISTLLRLAETYTSHGKDVAGQSTGAVKGAHTDDGLRSAEADLKVLIERFANSTSMDDLVDSVNQIYKDADQDPELKNWFRHLDTYIRKCLQQQGFVMQDAATEEWNEIYDKGNFLLRERYRNHTDRVGDEIKFLADQFEQDPQNKAFGDAMNKLFLDLGQDENGKPVFKKHLVTDLTNVILPAFFENVRYVPIPRIEYSDPMVDAIVENLVIEGDNLAPNVFEFASDNHWRWGRKQIANKNKNKVMLSASGIQMDLKDVSYYIKKKQGFPSITDKGVMDIFLGGSGFSFKAALETADSSDKNHFFKVNTVTVDIKNLKIKLKKSNYKLLFGIVKPLLLRVMRPILQKVIQKAIKDNINKLDAYCYEVKKEADRATEQAKNNPDEAVNIFQRYFNAAQQRLAQGKEKAQAATEDKTANIAITQHDSIFKDISLPGGISTKATEYKTLAAKGDKWESPVFLIGSASESTGLPTVAPVTRKPHSATEAVLKPHTGTNGTAA
ncbi:hypothetical protein FH972_024444 [Carpinus fangiana]|uniref:Uncharacterized protein n=1 Tax=Carpinus fangiana TaxID=176857 RepID=A0A5N6KY21_9ROSI|nr:hypothetical protein FH972_024444 [Carpinus fangiana]